MLTPCTPEILDATERQREIMLLEEFQCADLQTNKHIVQGQWASVLSHYPSFQLRTCQQVAETPNEECGSEAEGREILKSLAMDIVYTDKYFDLAEFKEHPLKKVLKYEFRPLNTLFKTGLLYSMKKNTVKV